jgi:hypothetical protein
MATKELMSIRGMVSQVSPESVQYPIVVETDSKSAIELIENGGGRNCKHFLRRVNFVREEVEKQNIRLRHVPSGEMCADMFTKNLAGVKIAKVSEEHFALY